MTHFTFRSNPAREPTHEVPVQVRARACPQTATLSQSQHMVGEKPLTVFDKPCERTRVHRIIVGARNLVFRLLPPGPTKGPLPASINEIENIFRFGDWGACSQLPPDGSHSCSPHSGPPAPLWSDQLFPPTSFARPHPLPPLLPATSPSRPADGNAGTEIGTKYEKPTRDIEHGHVTAVRPTNSQRPACRASIRW